MSDRFAYRVATGDDWRAAQANGAFHSSDLDAEGFIHTSRLGQVEVR